MNPTDADRIIIARCGTLGLSLSHAQRLAGVDHSPQDLAHVLGLDPRTLAPLKPRNWLSMAANTSSVSYRVTLSPDGLLEVLTTGIVPPAAFSTVLHFLDEAPLQVVVMAIEQAAKQSSVSAALIWSNVDRIAAASSSTRLRSLPT